MRRDKCRGRSHAALDWSGCALRQQTTGTQTTRQQALVRSAVDFVQAELQKQAALGEAERHKEWQVDSAHPHEALAPGPIPPALAPFRIPPFFRRPGRQAVSALAAHSRTDRRRAMQAAHSEIEARAGEIGRSVDGRTHARTRTHAHTH